MDELDRALKQASRHIISLTYNRIVGGDFSNLTAFQQDVIQDVVCQQADFEWENADDQHHPAGLQHQRCIPHSSAELLERLHG